MIGAIRAIEGSGAFFLERSPTVGRIRFGAGSYLAINGRAALLACPLVVGGAGVAVASPWAWLSARVLPALA